MTDGSYEVAQANALSSARLYLTGPFGCGKSTLARDRVHWLLGEGGASGSQIMVLVPQPINLEFYRARLASSASQPGPPVEVTTVATVARRSVELLWPQIAREAGFAAPQREPTYLNVEAVQYHLGHFVDEAIDRREFAGVSVTRQRIILQLVNTLNRAALYHLTLEDAYDRLDALPGGKRSAAHLHALHAAREASLAFRAHCLKESLVDFSLLMEVFRRQVLGDAHRCRFLLGSVRHLVADNMEEDNPVSHALIRAWAPSLDSLLIAVDEDASYRRMLGADALGAENLCDLCDLSIRLPVSRITPRPLQRLEQAFDRALGRPPGRSRTVDSPDADNTPAGVMPVPARSDEPASPVANLRVPRDEHGRTFRYYPQMIRWVAREVRRLVDEEGVDPGQVVIVSPIIGDALRFSLQSELTRLGIESTAHRPSRALLDEPATRCLLALAAVAHPNWKHAPPREDMQHALQTGIAGLDPLRASLLTSEVYRLRGSFGELGEIGQNDRSLRPRITFRLSESYEVLREWLQRYRSQGAQAPVDQFFSQLFEEVLSRARFGLHDDMDSMRAANQLVESARSLRWSLANDDDPDDGLGADYLDMVGQGVLGALRVPAWEPPSNAVLISPVSAYLVRNRPAEYQFWLDVGSNGWWERIYQPLTHIGVLTPDWPADLIWTDADEYAARQVIMRNLIAGLLRRTLKTVYVMVTDYNESGYEQRGPLLAAVNRVLAQIRA